MIFKIIILVLILASLYQLVHIEEGFQNKNDIDISGCQTTVVCPPPTRCPDMSKFVLKSSIPPCPAKPDLSKYVLRSSVPPMPDMDKYVLKSSVPACPACPECPKPKYKKEHCLLNCGQHFPRSTYVVKPVTIKPVTIAPVKEVVIDQHGNKHNKHKNTHNTDKIKDFYSRSPTESHYFSGNHYAKVHGIHNKLI